MAWSGREALPEFWEWLGSALEGLKVVGRCSRRSGSSREALPTARVWSGGLSRGPGVFGKGLEAFAKDREWSRGTSRGTGVVRMLFRSVKVVGNSWEALSECREWLGALPEVREWSGGAPGGP